MIYIEKNKVFTYSYELLQSNINYYIDNLIIHIY